MGCFFENLRLLFLNALLYNPLYSYSGSNACNKENYSPSLAFGKVEVVLHGFVCGICHDSMQN